MLQYLRLPCVITTLQFLPYLKINGKNWLGDFHEWNKQGLDMLCQMLQSICYISTNVNIETNVTWYQYRYSNKAEIVKYVTARKTEFEALKYQLPTLQWLCIVCIRQNLPVKTSEKYAALGLPDRLLRLVTLSKVAEEMYEKMRPPKSKCKDCMGI